MMNFYKFHSPFRVYRKNWSSNDKSVDSDRLFEWDSEKYNELSKEIFGNKGGDRVL